MHWDAERGARIEGETTAQVIEGYLQKNEVSEHSSILNTTDIAIQKNKKVRELITNGWGVL